MSDSPVSSHGSVGKGPVGHKEDLNRGMPPVSPARASPAAEQDEGQMDAQGASPTPDRPGQGRPDHDVDAGPTGDHRQQELEEVEAEMTFIMQRTDHGDRTHSSRDELQGAMSHRDGELRTEDTECEELRSFAVGLMPHPVLSRATSRVTTLQEMGAGSSGEAGMVHGRTDTGPGCHGPDVCHNPAAAAAAADSTACGIDGATAKATGNLGKAVGPAGPCPANHVWNNERAGPLQWQYSFCEREASEAEGHGDHDEETGPAHPAAPSAPTASIEWSKPSHWWWCLWDNHW